MEAFLFLNWYHEKVVQVIESNLKSRNYNDSCEERWCFVYNVRPITVDSSVSVSKYQVTKTLVYDNSCFEHESRRFAQQTSG